MKFDRQQPWILPVGLFLIGLILFLFRIQAVDHLYFDEVRYVPAAKQFLAHGMNENWSHPPLGKLLIGVGIGIGGDGPLGWRLMSGVFGALTLVAMYFLGVLLLGRREDGMRVAVLSLLNQMLFVQARIAMLDVFMFAFIALGLGAACKGLREGKPRWHTVAGVLLGLSCACKWFGLVPLIFCAAFLIVRPDGKPIGSRVKAAAFSFGLSSVLAYALVALFLLGMGHPSYAPPLDPQAHPGGPRYSVVDLVPLQQKMLKSQLDFTNAWQPYESPWYQWPLAVRPTWYERTEASINGILFGQGVFLLGNPFIALLGLAAAFASAAVIVRSRARDFEATWAGLLFFALWLGWLLIPRRTHFYYYYFPAFMILSLVIADWMRRLRISIWAEGTIFGTCFASFIYFYPVFSGLWTPMPALFSRIWFKAWL